MEMKRKRQAEILAIIAEETVETQEQLLAALGRRGIQVTQATISRDIKELHLIKELSPSGVYRYVPSPQSGAPGAVPRLQGIFQEGAITFTCAQNLVVAKTMPGLASAAGAALDGMEIPELLGTLAGDDTVLLIFRSHESAQRFCATAHTLFS